MRVLVSRELIWVLGIIALSFTLISVFTLSGPGPFSRVFTPASKQV